MKSNEARKALFAAARELDEARTEIKKAARRRRNKPSVADQERMVRRYRAACLALTQAAVTYTGERMREHEEDMFAKLFPTGWFVVVDGYPQVKGLPQ